MDRFPDLLDKAAALNPSRTAMREIATGRSCTYTELNGAASRCAALLRAEGVGEGDRVAILCRNRIEFFECLFACVRIGAVLVPLNWRMPAAELKPILKMADPALCLAGAEDAETLAAALEATGDACPLIMLDGTGGDGYAARRDAAGPFGPVASWPADRVWYLLFTSGTTGMPKAVIQTCAMSLVNYVNIGRVIDLSPNDRTLNFLPLFHTAGINLHTLPTLYEGGTVLILPGFDPGRVLQLAAEQAFDSFFGVPAVYQALANHPGFADSDLSSVRSWGCGGAPLPTYLVETYAARGILVCNGMGMTETGPTLFLMRPEDVTAKIGSVGKPQLLSEVRLITADGTQAARGEVGEVQIRGPGVTPGYWNNDRATKETFTEDGWLRSGDLGRQDEDGFYFIVGRSKEMFISGGENVYPAEVENVLNSHEAVADAAVVAMADERWGEVGVAWVQAADGADLDPGELSAWCRAHLAPFKVPKHFRLIAEFPRTAAGKIQKHLLGRE